MQSTEASPKPRAFRRALVCALLLVNSVGCGPGARQDARYFGKTEPPAGQVLRYISGPEPESLDPQVGTGQPEARFYMALFEGLAEYDPKTMEPIPAVAERWETNADSTEFVFQLRRDARWSDGEPVTAHDFVYSWRRGLSPELASRNAYLAYYVKYAQAYNDGAAFVRDKATGEFLPEKDFKTDPAQTNEPAPAAAPASAAPTKEATKEPAAAKADSAAAKKGGEASAGSGSPSDATTESATPDTPFHQFISSPARLTVPGTEKERAKAFAADARLAAAVAGKEFVPVRGEDIGVEAVDDYTLRVTLSQPTPFFVGLVAHPFFRPVPRRVVEAHKEGWTRPEHIVGNGPFKLRTWRPYDEIVVVRNPAYWDAARVKLEEIHFVALDETTTMMNLYKAGEVDALSNHSVPAAWVEGIEPLKDYMNAPELAIIYYLVNTTKPPMTDARVRRAFNLSVDKRALADYWHVPAPLNTFTPEGIFPGYPPPEVEGFNPARARQLLAEAGYRDGSGNFDPAKFPASEVEICYPSSDANRHVAEFVQAQWKQNLGLTVTLRNMEFKTYLTHRATLSYKGFAVSGYAGDYVDPFTFLNLLAAPAKDNGTGWWDARYVRMLDEANAAPDRARRFQLLARAESYMLAAQPVLPLYVPSTKWMKKPYVKGMYPNPGTLHAWKFVSIEHDPAKWD